MALYNFNDFVNESYLKGSRQPLYHGTKRLNQILQEDTLKVHKPAFDPLGRDSISFTRSKFYMDYGDIRLLLDADLMHADNYYTEPVDEIGMAIGKNNHFNNPKYAGYSKANIAFKNTPHNLNIPKTRTVFNMAQEHEERIYKNITNLGKYIMEIIFDDKTIIPHDYRKAIDDYLEKYPHILITNSKGQLLYSIKDIHPELGVEDVVNNNASLVDVNAE